VQIYDESIKLNFSYILTKMPWVFAQNSLSKKAIIEIKNQNSVLTIKFSKFPKEQQKIQARHYK